MDPSPLPLHLTASFCTYVSMLWHSREQLKDEEKEEEEQQKLEQQELEQDNIIKPTNE